MKHFITYIAVVTLVFMHLKAESADAEGMDYKEPAISEIMDSCYKDAREGKALYGGYSSLRDFEDFVSKTSKEEQERLNISIPWLEDIMYDAILGYASIKKDDPIIQATFRKLYHPVFQKDYDFCWLEFRKWDHFLRDQYTTGYVTGMGDTFGYLEQGIIFSDGKMYILARHLSLDISPNILYSTGGVEVRSLHNFLRGDYKREYVNLIEDEEYRNDPKILKQVINQLLRTDNAWFHPDSLYVMVYSLPEEEYAKWLKEFRKMQRPQQTAYSAEQLLLAEQVYSRGDIVDPKGLRFGDMTPEYYLYGFDSQIVGVSNRSHIDGIIRNYSLHSIFDHFFLFVIGELESKLMDNSLDISTFAQDEEILEYDSYLIYFKDDTYSCKENMASPYLMYHLVKLTGKSKGELLKSMKLGHRQPLWEGTDEKIFNKYKKVLEHTLAGYQVSRRSALKAFPAQHDEQETRD